MCYILWYNAPTMLPAGGRQHRGCIIPQAVTHSLLLLMMGKIIARNMLTHVNTQSSAPEDGKNNCPKHVELTGIINKPLLLHLVGCLYYVYQ